MSGKIASPADVLAFWRDAGRDKWFTQDDAFDAEIREKFLATYEAATAGKLSAWEDSAEDTLALVIVLDQFPRNLFRGDARTSGSCCPATPGRCFCACAARSR